MLRMPPAEQANAYAKAMGMLTRRGPEASLLRVNDHLAQADEGMNASNPEKRRWWESFRSQ
jgi:hypothetical protein